MLFSKELEDPLRSQLRDALMELGQPEHQSLMQKFISGIFVRFEPATTQEHLGALQSYLESTGLAFTEPAAAGPPPEPPEDRPLVTAPPDASQMDVELGEWFARTEVERVAAGKIYFLAENTGEEPHNLVIARTDLPADRLPLTGEGRVDETQLEIVGEIEPFAAGSRAAATFDLAPGRYVLFCSIVEVEPAEDEIESHYLLGMDTVLSVE